MAKQQTFGDKLKKKSDEMISVKVIKGIPSDKGNLRFIESIVKVKDINEVTNIDLT
ncbi:MAG: hypothetical protein ACLFQX_12840 [Candidatus Kapaibacterium sp.]